MRSGEALPKFRDLPSQAHKYTAMSHNQNAFIETQLVSDAYEQLSTLDPKLSMSAFSKRYLKRHRSYLSWLQKSAIVSPTLTLLDLAATCSDELAVRQTTTQLSLTPSQQSKIVTLRQITSAINSYLQQRGRQSCD